MAQRPRKAFLNGKIVVVTLLNSFLENTPSTFSNDRSRWFVSEVWKKYFCYITQSRRSTEVGRESSNFLLRCELGKRFSAFFHVRRAFTHSSGHKEEKDRPEQEQACRRLSSEEPSETQNQNSNIFLNVAKGLPEPPRHFISLLSPITCLSLLTSSTAF
jgi:hypothetical protein